jgi:sugar lactone lactonase YvrE
MATDPGTQQILLTGGTKGGGTNLGDTWTFQNTWTQQQPPTSPPARQAAAIAYDPGSGHLLLFGGAGSGFLGDSWVWGPLAIDQPPLPAATSGLNYFAGLQAIAGVGTLTWSLASGSLPAGLRLSAGGAIYGMPTTPGSATFTLRVTDSSTPTPQTATKTFQMTVLPGPTPGVYVANGANSAINAFALGASGNAKPVATIAGPNTGLNGPAGLAFDIHGDLYVANSNTASILEYPAGAYGNVTPGRTIIGPATGLASPSGLTVAGLGDVYVTNTPANSVTEYWPGANGNASPRHTIAGPHTGLSSPRAVVVDAAGHVWVANAGSNTLTVYAAGADGDAAPVASIAGPTTGLRSPQALTQDSNGAIVVANTVGESITRYPNPGPTGNIFPSSQITGPATQLSFPDGIDVDTNNLLYVANQFGGVNIYTSLGPADNVAPLGIISGPATGLAAPAALAVTPPMMITTTTLPAAGVDERYRARIGEVLGRRPVHFRLARGHLPAGLRLTHDGIIHGTPRRIGVYRFTVRATDSTRPTMRATRTITLTVIRPPTVRRVVPATGTRHGGTHVTILARTTFRRVQRSHRGSRPSR